MRLEGNLLFLLLFLLLFIFLFVVKRFPKSHLLLTTGMFLLFFLQADIQERQNQTMLSGSEKKFQITFQNPMKLDGNYFSSYGKDERTGEKVVLRYRISSEKEKGELAGISPGYVCQVEGVLEKPELPGNLGMFNYKEYLRKENINWILKANQMNIQQCSKEKNVMTVIQTIRQRGIHYIQSHFPPETSPQAAALIFGDRATIEPDLLTAYQKLGIIHLLAISGLHVGMLMGILFYIGLRLNITREKVTNILLGFLPIYIILTGGSPSVVRACFMMMAVLVLSKMKRNRFLPADIVSIVFLFYIFLQPFVIYDIGFQLSFSVTFSLILSTPILAKYKSRPLHIMMVTSLVAQIASMPFLLYHFYEFSIVSVFANILYVPLYSLFILPAMLILLLFHLVLGDFISPILMLLNSILVILKNVTLFLSQLPFNTIVLGRPSPFLMLLSTFALPIAFFTWETAWKRKKLFYPFAIVLVLIMIHLLNARYSMTGEVTVIDVGQGDSILIRLPLNKGTYLIDTGGSLQIPTEDWMKRMDPFEVGKDVLVPFLKSNGIATIDKLILTHGDMDHIGGAKAVLANLHIKEIVLPKIKQPSDLETEIIMIAKNKNIPVRFAQKGDVWMDSSYTFRVLSPTTKKDMERNDQSLVLYTELGGVKWLLTGDLEEEGEKELIKNYPKLHADILKVGHHGSKTSSTELLLNQLHPKAALISVGKDNRFGHPHGEVMDRFEERKVKVFRTDQDGAITYKFTGEEGTFFAHYHMIKQKLK